MGDLWRDAERIADAGERAYEQSGSAWEAIAAGLWEGARIVGEELGDGGHEGSTARPARPERRGEGSIESPGDISSTSEVVISRTFMMDQARLNFENPEDLRRWQDDIGEFEARARRDRLSPLEVASTYHELGALLAPREGAVIDQDRREQLAREVLHQAAFPYGIDQGRHNTCAVSALESRLYARNPQAAAATIRELATSSTGEFTTTDGRRLRVEPASLAPDAEAARQPRPDGERTYASQVLQLAMVNAHWSEQSSHGVGASRTTGPFTYRQQHNVSDGDSGERLIDGSGRVVAAAPDIRAQDLPGIYRQFSTEQAPPFVIVHRSRLSPTADGQPREGIVVVDSEEDLRRAVSDLQDRHNMPPVVQVDPERPPWSNSSGRLAAAGAGSTGRAPLGEYAQAAAATSDNPDNHLPIQPGPRLIPVDREHNSHVVNIVTMTTDPATRRVTTHVSNTWGDRSDIDVDLPTLYRSM